MGQAEPLLFIGVDAGDFRTIDPLVEEGELPNISSLMQDGLTATLDSTIPPWTPSAWTSLTCGKNPGKHGIFDFKQFTEDRLVDSTDVKSLRFWDYLSLADRRSVVLNVPVTNPAPEINGVLIPGYLGPEVDDINAHPDDIVEELQSAIGEYRVYKRPSQVSDDALCEEYIELMEMRRDAAIYLADTYDYDLFMIQFQRTDTVFHELPEDHYIEGVYRTLDQCVGDLIEEIDHGTVIIASDHGMGKTGDWDVRINAWLKTHGYLKASTDGFESGWESPAAKDDSSPKHSGAQYLSRVLSAAGLTPQRIEEFLASFGLADHVQRAIPDEVLRTVLATGGEKIDIENSAAYCPSGPGLGIYCPDIETDEIINQLCDLETPDGKPVFQAVADATHIYEGDYVDRGPDIVFLPRNMDFYVSATVSNEIFDTSNYQYNHKNEGILIASGEQVDSGGGQSQYGIYDIAPTVLSLYGLPLDEEFDGECIAAITDAVDETKQYSATAQDHEETNLDEVLTRLEGLGYMD